MKRIVLAFVAFFVFSSAFADVEKNIQFKKLPKLAQNFIKATYPNGKLVSVKEEYEQTHDKKTYEVKFADGVEIEFDKMGVWKEIDGNHKAVPTNELPKPMLKFIAETYPKEKVVKIDRDLFGYEVELTNGKELVFDDKGIFLRFDD